MKYIARCALPALCLSACVVGDAGTGQEPEAEDNEDTGGSGQDPGADDDRPSVDGAFGLITSPRHGDLITGDTSRALIAFRGYHEQPGYELEIQVLEDPYDLASWMTIAVGQSGEQEDEDGLYAWTAVVDPTADDRFDRWPQGGILRLRVRGEQGELLTRLYRDAAGCDEEESLRELATSCGDVVDTGLVVVSPALAVADDPVLRPGFLLEKGVGTPAETDEYYATIDAPATADDFRTRFGFDAAVDPVATYYNRGDLATGREVRCREYTIEETTGVACITGNYGLFSGDENLSLEQAIEGTESQVSDGAFALVAMVYVPPITAPNSVQFMVYGANGQLINEAELDTHGDNASIPHNCINCHGSAASYDPQENSVTGAQFLPFDMDAFGFSTEPGYTRAAQEEPIRELNELVSRTEIASGSLDLIEGWYGAGLEVPGTTADTTFIPVGWQQSLRVRETYTNTIALACRGCHMSRELVPGAGDPLDFTSAQKTLPLAASIGSVVCGSDRGAGPHQMPNAQAVVRRFWSGSARAYLADLFEVAGPCAP